MAERIIIGLLSEMDIASQGAKQYARSPSTTAHCVFYDTCVIYSLRVMNMSR